MNKVTVVSGNKTAAAPRPGTSGWWAPPIPTPKSRVPSRETMATIWTPFGNTWLGSKPTTYQTTQNSFCVPEDETANFNISAGLEVHFRDTILPTLVLTSGFTRLSCGPPPPGIDEPNG